MSRTFTLIPTSLVVLFVSFLLPLNSLGASPNPKELLQQVDEQRNLPDLAVDITLTSWENATVLNRNVLKVFTHTSSAANQTLVWFQEPSEVRGRKMLMQGNGVYLLFPKTRNPVRLSPLQVLMGESSNGDIARTAFSLDYEALSVKETTWESIPAYQISLQVLPARQGSSYGRIELTVDAKKLRPLYAEFADAAGKVAKTVRYSDFRKIGTKELPFLLDIQDVENTSHHTTIAYTAIQEQTLPENYFRKEYLALWLPVEAK